MRLVPSIEDGIAEQRSAKAELMSVGLAVAAIDAVYCWLNQAGI